MSDVGAFDMMFSRKSMEKINTATAVFCSRNAFDFLLIFLLLTMLFSDIYNSHYA